MQEEMSQVLDAMFEKFCTEGEHIIDQDDDGDNFYVIERYIFTWLHTLRPESGQWLLNK